MSVLPQPPAAYSPRHERQRNRILEIADGQNRKVGQDVEISDERLILKSANGSRWAIEVSDMGLISATLVT